MTAIEALPPRLLGIADAMSGNAPFRVGMVLHRSDKPKSGSEKNRTYDVAYELFVNPPTVTQTGLATLVIDLETRAASLTSVTPGAVEMFGSFSVDFQHFKGLVTFRDFQLMHISGTFENCPIEVTRDEDD